jgi:hypothetical protein
MKAILGGKQFLQAMWSTSRSKSDVEHLVDKSPNVLRIDGSEIARKRREVGNQLCAKFKNIQCGTGNYEMKDEVR